TRCDQEPAGSRPKIRAAVSICHQTVPLSGENLFPAACARPLLCSAAKPMLPADSTWVDDGNNFLKARDLAFPPYPRSEPAAPAVPSKNRVRHTDFAATLGLCGCCNWCRIESPAHQRP